MSKSVGNSNPKRSDDMENFWDYAHDDNITTAAHNPVRNRSSSSQNVVPKLDEFWDYTPPAVEENHRTSHGGGSGHESSKLENEFWGYPPVLDTFWRYSEHKLPNLSQTSEKPGNVTTREPPTSAEVNRAAPLSPFEHDTYNSDFRSKGTQVKVLPAAYSASGGVRKSTPQNDELENITSISRSMDRDHSSLGEEMSDFWNYPEDLEPYWDYAVTQHNGDLRPRRSSADNIANPNKDREPRLSMEASNIAGSKEQLRSPRSLPNLNQEAKAFTRPSKFSSARCKTTIKCGGPKDFPGGQNVYYNDGREIRHTVKSKEYSDVCHIKRCVIDQIDFIKQRDGIWSYQRLYRAVYILANFMKEHKFIYKYLQDSQRQWMEDIAKRMDGWTYLMTPMSCTFTKWRQEKLRRRARAEQMARDCFRLVNPQNYDKQEREKKRANALIHAERMRLKKLDRERKKVMLDRITRLSYAHSRKARQGDQKMPIQLRPPRFSDLVGADLFEGALKFRGDWKPADKRRFPHRSFGETLHDLHIAKLFKRGMWGRLPTRPTVVKFGKCSKVSRTSTIKPLTKQDDPCNAYRPFKPMKRISRPGRLFEYEEKQKAAKLAAKHVEVTKEAKALHAPKDEVAKIMDLIDEIEAKHGKITQAKTGHFPPGELARVIDLIETIESKQAEINHELLTIRQTGARPKAKLRPPSPIKPRYVKTAPKPRAGDLIPKPRRPRTAGPPGSNARDGQRQRGGSGPGGKDANSDLRQFWDYPPNLEPYWKFSKEPEPRTPAAPVRGSLPSPTGERKRSSKDQSGQRSSSPSPVTRRTTRTSSSRPKTVPARLVKLSTSPKPANLRHQNGVNSRPRNVSPATRRGRESSRTRSKSRTKSSKHHKAPPALTEPEYEPPVEIRDSLEHDAQLIVSEVTDLSDSSRDFWNYPPNIREFWNEPPDIKPFWGYSKHSLDASRNLSPSSPSPPHTASSQTSFSSQHARDLRNPHPSTSRRGQSSEKLNSKVYQDGIDAAIDDYVDELLRQEFALKAARSQNRRE